MVFYDFVIFILSLLAIVIGAEFLVSSASKIAKHLNTNDFIIGLTLVAIGTSLPELSIAVSASLKSEGIITIGNLMGASIANLGLTLGIISVIYTIGLKSNLLKRDTIILLIATLLFFFSSLDKVITKTEGIVLLIFFAYYLIDLARSNKLREKFIFHIHKPEEEINLPKQFLFVSIGLGLLYIGARYLIPSTVNIANFIGIPEEIIALTVISIGTTLPELTVTIVAAKKGLTNLLLGNLVGSNITNLALIIGIASIINPVNISNLLLYYIMPYLLIITLIFFIFSKSDRISRIFQGLILLMLYVAYIVTLIITRFN